MKQEIERKFLVRKELWQPPPAARPHRIRQGYLGPPDAEPVRRVRILDDAGWLTEKGPPTAPGQRAEVETPIPLADAQARLGGLPPERVIEKLRYRIPYEGKTWEVDVFAGVNAGLVLAELELEHLDEPVALPPWIGVEVTADARYYNHYLAYHPFTQWPAPA